MLAYATGAQELRLETPEAKELAKAIGEVQEHYPLALDPKTQAWINLAMVAGFVYGPRFYAMRQRKRGKVINAKSPERKPEPEPVGPVKEKPPRKADIDKDETRVANGPTVPSELYGAINPSDPPSMAG